LIFLNCLSKCQLSSTKVEQDTLCGKFNLFRKHGIPHQLNSLAIFIPKFGSRNCMNAKIAIIMGSISDWDVMKPAADIIAQFEVTCKVDIVSAHRTPEYMLDFAKSAKANGFSVIIAGAGGAAHLPGMVASATTLPVIGVPVKSSNSIDGWDSVLSILQMPAGVPVATVALNNATNAALLALQIIGTSDESLSGKLERYKKDLEEKVKTSRNQIPAHLR
jgi:5-(carboxyamino)imidazole ribonucleotide mutase